MTGVRSYAGYINNNSGKKLAFSIIVNNAEGMDSEVKIKIEELMNHIGTL
jgi:D-alanyl-D-alanine carboxypeptidase